MNTDIRILLYVHVNIILTHMQFLAARSRWMNLLSARYSIPFAISKHIFINVSSDKFYRWKFQNEYFEDTQLAIYLSSYDYDKNYHIRQNIQGGKLPRLEWEMAIHWKTFTLACLYCRLILPIDKAIIHGKTFTIKWKTTKSMKFSPSNVLLYMVLY